MNYFELKEILVKQFEDAGISEMSDIDWIMVEVTKIKRSMLPLAGNFSNTQIEEILEAGRKRAEHIPIGLIFGRTEFYGREFKVSNDTLIPRLDTEILIDEFLKETKNTIDFYKVNKESFSNYKPSILDIGTGSGAIAITLKKETNFDVYAIDISQKALEKAKENAKLNDADITFIQSDLFENIDNLKVDFIVSNPPYIKSDVVLTLEREVKDNEPILALDGGEDGLDFYRKITTEAKNHLNQNGMLFFEIGYDQADAVVDLMKANFDDIKVVKDYGGNDRVVYGKLRS